MEETEVLIIGQGLAGTWLSFWLHKAGVSFKIIDHPVPGGASRHAAGLINPVTGRRMVTTWMIDELMPFASEAYHAFGNFLDTKVVSETSLVDFFPSVQMLQAFQKRYAEDPVYLRPGKDPEKYSKWFRYELGWGSIQPCQLVNVEKLLTGWRNWLMKNNLIVESVFNMTHLQRMAKGVEYEGIHARYIVFCDGKSAVQNPYFDKLPFALNKGEGLLVEIKDLPATHAFKKGMSLIPYRENIFWLGSSYEWSFSDELPTEKFRNNAENWLKGFLKMPYRVTEHFAALRPATLERRPFVGFHPKYPSMGILNGLGTKGCSLSPFFAKQLSDKITDKGIIYPLADISRFEKVLARVH
jgi:glycine/D-amino acid oxidase-like deaminating enzyme